MTVVPVRIEDVRPEGAMEYALGNTHWLDAFAPPVERQLEKLAQSVKTLLANEVERPQDSRVAGDDAAEGKANSRIEPGDPRRSHLFWLIAGVASLIGFVALGAIVLMC
jgi:hypothetical protein